MRERTDDTGAAYAGSQLQTQLWVNVHPEQLAGEVAEALSDLDAEAISWVSQLRAESFREYQDGAFCVTSALITQRSCRRSGLPKDRCGTVLGMWKTITSRPAGPA